MTRPGLDPLASGELVCFQQAMPLQLPPAGPMHIVEIPCTCPDIENCRTQRYVADVRIAIVRLAALTRALCGMRRTPKKLIQPAVWRTSRR